MNVRNFRFSWSALVVAVVLTSPTPGLGQIEEVIVTARKRQESLQEVPISVQAFSGERLQEQGITDIQAMSGSIPNFSYSQAVGASDVLVMRGLGTVGSGPHMEQAVGQIFNGFFTTRSRMGRASFVDMAQLEVLRGPQGPIIGKNTSLGAIIVTSNKPTDDAEFSVLAGWDLDHSEGYEIQGIASGPLGDAVRARGVINVKDKDGWTTNQPSGNDQRKRDDLTGRLIVDWDVTDTFSAEFLYQTSDYDREGKPREISECLDPAAVAANPTFASEDCSLNGVNNSAAILSGAFLGTGTDVDAGEGFELDADLWGLTLEWETDNFTLTSLTGYIDYDMFDQFDSDLTPSGPRVIFNTEDFEQLTQELRITASAGDSLDYIIGANYFTSDLAFIQVFDNHTNRRRFEDAVVETDSISVFGQGDWHLNDAFDLTLGLRWTDEEREGSKNQKQFLYGSNTGNRCTPSQTSGLTSCFDAPLTGETDESNVSWNVALRWHQSESSMYYVSAATGFKSSGFNIRQNAEISDQDVINNPALTANTDNFIFGDEESFNVEIGGKHDLADGRVRLNWTIYSTEIDGLQLSSNDPVNISQAVVNGDATGTGLEFDLLWAATDALTLGLNGAFSNTEYDEFLGACYTVPQQTFAQGCDVDADGIDDSATNEEFQDLSGEEPPFAPDVTVVATADYTWQVSENDLTLRLRAYNVGEQWIAVTQHPFSREDSYTKWDASLVLADGDGRWNVALVGKNLSDELVRNWNEPTTAFNAVGGAHYAFIDERRTVALRGEIVF